MSLEKATIFVIGKANFIDLNYCGVNTLVNYLYHAKVKYYFHSYESQLMKGRFELINREVAVRLSRKHM